MQQVKSHSSSSLLRFIYDKKPETDRKFTYCLISLNKKNKPKDLSHPTPRPMGEGPQMYKYGGTVVKSMHFGDRQIWNIYPTTS